MEKLISILPFLPLELECGVLVWPHRAIEAFEALSKGPNYSRVDSGEFLSVSISDIRTSLSFPFPSLSPAVANGYTLFFDQVLSRDESGRWFGEVVPVMSKLLLRLPMLLQSHYQDSERFFGVDTGLRLLEPQNSGIVILHQELIAALLCCSFFCLFPAAERQSKSLPRINFDLMFRSLYERHTQHLEHKLRCIIHYFERICSNIPTHFVSFERKVLPVTNPDVEYWRKSSLPLCPFQVCKTGLIEDHLGGALEVDFANKNLGGGALRRGCVQEEIRFMINPELIAGMFFLPTMLDNEAIEIVGAERYSDYTGYSSTFRLSGDYVDSTEIDLIGRRKTRIVAIDAVRKPGNKQYRVELLLREINKALCGFTDQLKHQIILHHQTVENEELNKLLNCYKISEAGIATGNWGCGAFGGDPQLKAVLQWIAASQATRPLITYYTFELDALENLDQFSEWIRCQQWTVGELWSIVMEYCSKRLRKETEVPPFFSWLLPSSPTQTGAYNST